MDSRTRTTILPNSIGFAFRRSLSDVAYCALTIRSGSKDEAPYGHGIAHYTEHILFKGTDRKSSSTINSYLERSGGDLNAFTTKEETVIHATVLKEELPKAVAILFELAFRSRFEEEDISMERSVIADEIQSFKDSPPDEIYDHFEELLFEGSRLGPRILGTSRSIKGINSEKIRAYVSDNFTNSRMALSIVADLEWEAALKIAVKAAAKSGVPEEKPDGKWESPYHPCKELKEGKHFSLRIAKRYHQTNCIIGCTGYPLGAERERIALVLLCNILGGPAANSILNNVLREKRGLVYGVDISYTPYSDNGAVAIAFGCDKENLEKCIGIIHKELEKVRTKPFSESALKAAKRQLKGQMSISSDNGENKCLAIGKNLLISGTDADEDKGMKVLDTITPGDIIRCASEIFSPERLSMLIYI